MDSTKKSLKDGDNAEMLTVKAEKREVFGKKLKSFREKGKLPAVLYGSGEKNTPLFISAIDFKKVWKVAGESSLVNLEVGGKKMKTLIYEVKLNSLTNEPQHADFYVVDLKKKITASIPLVFEGVAPAIKNLGGALVKVIHEVEVESLPGNLPHKIEVNLNNLKTFDDRITIANLKVSDDVQILAEPEEVVCLVEEVKEIEEEATEASIEDIEVLGGKKKEEEIIDGDENKKEEKNVESSGK